MKSFNALIISLTLLFASFSGTLQAQTTHTASMGNQYVNEVFFSLTNGEVRTSPRNLWDIAFFTPAFSAGIIVNDGAGVALYTYPNAGISGWETFDTTGMASWKRLYNNTTDFEDGAFNRNALGHPDYGWGIYSMTSHDVVGDSLYLIATPDGMYRKLQIVRKISTQNKYIIRHANLDGSNDQTDTLEVTPHITKQFMAFSFANGIVDREPDAADWDLLFTRYNAVVQNTYYPVNGVLTRKGHTVAEAHPVAPDFTDWTDLTFSPDADIIGHDWKTINMSTFQWEITDSLAYFVQTDNGSVYKVVFEAFSGSSTGTTTFTVQAISTASAPAFELSGVNIYPNPAGDYFRITFSSPLSNASAVLYDLSGRAVAQQSLGNALSGEISLDGVARGSYILRITSETGTLSRKVIVR
ncbi:T9SS type A sorting domain-containing protein [Lentimicrobium sp.]|uniref:T9SS type A sorting domain-containing protein n=1 Tax=Lentimicrobium sp. TaxID=2034841 RepID=UPI002B8900C4|nr:T9SS type A sorting domain-containing protein [Lentimicrobium sp.]HPF64036.1 T9SS type A sorting domain-containing protein [Lentimicrobium sp.]HPR26604.1 T9SS type A sorting domain-containing protein [Lentimicrobium sp.]